MHLYIESSNTWHLIISKLTIVLMEIKLVPNFGTLICENEFISQVVLQGKKKSHQSRRWWEEERSMLTGSWPKGTLRLDIAGTPGSVNIPPFWCPTPLLAVHDLHNF